MARLRRLKKPITIHEQSAELTGLVTARFDDNSTGRRVASCAVVAFVALAMLALFARSAIDHPPIYDELLHVLAARGIVETGAPLVADGRYTRALMYSQAVAWAFKIRGDDLVSARL